MNIKDLNNFISKYEEYFKEISKNKNHQVDDVLKKKANEIYTQFAAQFPDSPYVCDSHASNSDLFCKKIGACLFDPKKNLSHLFPVVQRGLDFGKTVEFILNNTSKTPNSYSLFVTKQNVFAYLTSEACVKKNEYVEKRNRFLDLFKGMDINELPEEIAKKLSSENPTCFFLNYQQDKEWRIAYDYIIWGRKLASTIKSKGRQFPELHLSDLYENNPDTVLELVKQKFNMWFNENRDALGRISYLDLRNSNLSSIPAELENLQNLQILYLQRNQIKTIPAELGNLQFLRCLYLQHNRIKTIPAELGNLQFLRCLYLQHNRIKTIPAELGNLQALLLK